MTASDEGEGLSAQERQRLCEALGLKADATFVDMWELAECARRAMSEYGEILIDNRIAEHGPMDAAEETYWREQFKRHPLAAIRRLEKRGWEVEEG